MSLKKLSLYQFKNYEALELEFNAPVVCFLGNNGQGKTNLLDAIYYLSFCKSYFNPIDSQNIKSGEDQGSIAGEFDRSNNLEAVHCALRKNQRKIFKRNHKEYDKLSEHIGLLPAVIVTPYDIELILEGSEVRRKFIDATISQYSKMYLDNLMSYNQALSQRNNLLKSFSKSGNYIPELLEPWDFQLIKYGQEIFEARRTFFEKFIPIFNEMYQKISGGAETVALEYKSDLFNASLEELLQKNKDRDRFLERTASGIHKDDMDFSIEGNALKKYASQGQQKSFLIALKLAQNEMLISAGAEAPILLLDDLYDKVDDTRVANLLNWLLNNHKGQIFISDTHVDRIPALLKEMNATFEAFLIEKGSAKSIHNELKEIQ
ncbi:MAG: DNA replication and repair protein RecF [Flavobacteriales bacterium]